MTKKTPIDTFEEFADPKKAVNSKECINRLLKDEWDVYDSLFYNARLGVSINPTRFIDPYILRKLRIETDIREMITQLGLGTMATCAYDLHVDLVRQFMATVELTYSTSKARVAGDGTLTFFARGIRYRISIPELCRIYGFDVAAAVSKIPPFLGLNGFWEIIGTGAWDSNSATQTDIRHPTLRYFLRALANTLVCKMEPNGLVDLTHLDENDDVVTPNLGSIFAAHMVDLKKKPFTGKGMKKKAVGSLLTPIFEYLGIRLDPRTADRSHRFLDEQHLMNSGWLKEELLWSFRIGSQHRLLQMPNRTIIDFDDSVDRLRFMPDAQLLRDLPAIPRRPPRVRRAKATQGPPEALSCTIRETFRG